MARRRPTVVARLMHGEQLAVRMMRAARSDEIGPEGEEDFVRLRRAALNAGLSFLPADSPFLGQDEIKLLACLTLLQRRQRGTVDADASLHDALSACAARLRDAGVTLDHSNVVRFYGGGFETLQADPSQSDRQCPAQAPGSDESLSASSPLARALRHVLDHGVVPARDFGRLGVSRDTVSRMYKLGLLRRVAYVKYVAATDRLSGLGQ